MVKKIHINLSNKVLYTFVTIIVILALGVGVYAFGGSYGDPAIMGHTADEIEGGGADTRCDVSGTCTQVCVGTNCKTSWPTGAVGGIEVKRVFAFDVITEAERTLVAWCPPGFVVSGGGHAIATSSPTSSYRVDRSTSTSFNDGWSVRYNNFVSPGELWGYAFALCTTGTSLDLPVILPNEAQLEVAVFGEGDVSFIGQDISGTCFSEQFCDFTFTNFPEGASVVFGSVPSSGQEHYAWGGDCEGVSAGTGCTLNFYGGGSYRVSSTFVVSGGSGGVDEGEMEVPT